MEKRFKVMELAGRFDMELSDLDTKDMNELMNEMGLDASALDRLTTLAYGVQGYISFFYRWRGRGKGMDDKERHKGARCSRSDTFRHCKGLYQGGVLQLFRPYGSRS